MLSNKTMIKKISKKKKTKKRKENVKSNITIDEHFCDHQSSCSGQYNRKRAYTLTFTRAQGSYLPKVTFINLMPVRY